jgi:hypothetical protein
MPTRDPAIQEFLTSLREAFRATAIGPEASVAIDWIYGAPQTLRAAGSEVAKRLPVCRYLDDAPARLVRAGPGRHTLQPAEHRACPGIGRGAAARLLVPLDREASVGPIAERRADMANSITRKDSLQEGKANVQRSDVDHCDSGRDLDRNGLYWAVAQLRGDGGGFVGGRTSPWSAERDELGIG